MLTAKRQPLVPYVIAVVNGGGDVVYRFNTKRGEGKRTNHDGPKPSLADIRAALARVAS